MLVLLERAPDFGTAGVAVVIGSGAAAEAPDKAGLAHLTEHLAFAAGRADGGVLQWTRDMGGHTNAFTSWDETTYVAVDLTSSLESLLGFCRGLVTDPLAGLDANTFLREQRIVADEMRLRTESGTPGEAIGWLTTAAFVQGHPYGHAIAGTRETITALKADDVRAFAATHYRAANSTLVVSAPINLAELQVMVERAMGGELHPVRGVRARPRPQQSFSAAATPARSFETREADVPTPMLWIGWSVPPVRESERLAPLVEEAFELKLISDLQRRDPDISVATADDLRGMDASLFFVRVFLKEGAHPDATIHSVVTELEGSLGWLAAQGGSAEAMKRRVAARGAYDEEEMFRRVSDLAWSYHHLGRPTFLGDRGQQILAASTAEATSYAHEFLTEPRAHAVLVKPVAGSGSEAAPPLASAHSAVASPTNGAPAAVVPAAAPAAASSPHPAGRLFGNLRSVQMPNGLRVLILPRPGSPFHTALLAFKGGYAEADPAGVTEAASWARTGNRGYDDFSAATLNLIRHHTVTPGATFDVVRGMGSNLGPTLDELGRVVGLATFWPPRQFTQMMDVFQRRERAPEAAFNRAMLHAFYGSHPLGRLPTVDDVAHIPPVKVQKWIDRTRRPENGLLIVIGDVDPDRTARDVEEALGHWGEGNGPARAAPPPPPLLGEIDPDSVGQVVVQHRPGSLQAKLDFRCLLPPASADGMAARSVFAGHLQRTMWRELREEIGASYSVHGRPRTLPGGTSVLDLTADIDYARLPEALRRLRTFVREAAAGSDPGGRDPTRDPSIALASERWRLENPTTYDMAETLLWLWVVDWPFDTMDRMPDQLKAVSGDSVRAIAQHCAKNWVVGLIGEESRLRRAWAQSASDTAGH